MPLRGKAVTTAQRGSGSPEQPDISKAKEKKQNREGSDDVMLSKAQSTINKPCRRSGFASHKQSQSPVWWGTAKGGKWGTFQLQYTWKGHLCGRIDMSF